VLSAFTDPTACIQLIGMIAGFGVVLEALQYVSLQHLFQESQMWSWSVLKHRQSWLHGSDLLARFWDRVLGYPGIVVLLGVRVVAGLLLLLSSGALGLQVLGLSAAFFTRALLDMRHRFMVGAENMLKIVIGALVLGHLSPHDPVLLEACLWGIALQSCWSYCANGWIKWHSSAWRCGDAMQLVAESKLYGSKRLSALLQVWPVLTKGFTWSAMILETAFPLVLVLGKPACWFFLGWGVVFHTFNAIFIGLNTFVPSFLVTYPAIWFVSIRIESIISTI
jgi:hypothetical protein